jgi:hypothetical protein
VVVGRRSPTDGTGLPATAMLLPDAFRDPFAGSKPTSAVGASSIDIIIFVT